MYLILYPYLLKVQRNVPNIISVPSESESTNIISVPFESNVPNIISVPSESTT